VAALTFAVAAGTVTIVGSAASLSYIVGTKTKVKW
jgi:hypothetical protein